MSIEKVLTDLTAAIEANSVVQEKVLMALTSQAKTGATRSAEKPATERKAAATRSDEKPATERKAGRAGQKAQKPKAPTEKDLLDVYGRYLGSATSKEEKSRLNDTIRPILDQFGVAKVSQIEPENYVEAIELGKMLQAAYDDGGVDAAEEVDLGLHGEDEGGDVL